MKTLKEIREVSGLSQPDFARKYRLPLDLLIDCEAGKKDLSKVLRISTLEVLETLVTSDKIRDELQCYKEVNLIEIGYFYNALLYVLNNNCFNPYKDASSYPIKYFMILFMLASKHGIPLDLLERIYLFIDSIPYKEWETSVSLPDEKKQYFMEGQIKFLNEVTKRNNQ